MTGNACVHISHIFIVTAEPTVSSSVNVRWTCKGAGIYVVYHKTSTHTATPTQPTRRSIPELTVTDSLADKSPHASGRAWYWGPPSSPRRTPRCIHPAHTHFIVGLMQCIHTQTHTPRSENPSTHRSAGIFFHSSVSIPCPSLSLPAILLLPSAASKPIRQEVTSWCCSQCGGRTMNVCVIGENGGETHTHTQTPPLTGLLCVPARPANLNSLPLTTHTL